MQNDDEALLSINLAGHFQLEKILITLEPHSIFSLNFAYLYILRLSLIYQIKLNKNRQEKERSKQSLFFYKSQETLKKINFYMGQQNLLSYKRIHICLWFNISE